MAQMANSVQASGEKENSPEKTVQKESLAEDISRNLQLLASDEYSIRRDASAKLAKLLAEANNSAALIPLICRKIEETASPGDREPQLRGLNAITEAFQLKADKMSKGLEEIKVKLLDRAKENEQNSIGLRHTLLVHQESFIVDSNYLFLELLAAVESLHSIPAVKWKREVKTPEFVRALASVFERLHSEKVLLDKTQGIFANDKEPLAQAAPVLSRTRALFPTILAAALRGDPHPPQNIAGVDLIAGRMAQDALKRITVYDQELKLRGIEEPFRGALVDIFIATAEKKVNAQEECEDAALAMAQDPEARAVVIEAKEDRRLMERRLRKMEKEAASWKIGERPYFIQAVCGAHSLLEERVLLAYLQYVLFGESKPGVSVSPQQTAALIEEMKRIAEKLEGMNFSAQVLTAVKDLITARIQCDPCFPLSACDFQELQPEDQAVGNEGAVLERSAQQMEEREVIVYQLTLRSSILIFDDQSPEEKSKILGGQVDEALDKIRRLSPGANESPEEEIKRIIDEQFMPAA